LGIVVLLSEARAERGLDRLPVARYHTAIDRIAIGHRIHRIDQQKIMISNERNRMAE
jgi:hypothetical protein